MKEPITNITYYNEYTDTYCGDFLFYYQLHIFSVPKIVSTYFNPEYVTIDQVKNIVENLLNTIRIRSNRKNEITLFEKDGKFLISENHEFIEPREILDFDENDNRYEITEDFDDLFDFIGDTKADVFIKNALISVGAEDLYTEIEPYVYKICEAQVSNNIWYEELRAKNKTNPLIKLEIYKIEKNYVPVKIKEFLCHNRESAMCLPEHKPVFDPDKRITFIIRDIATDKIIEGNLNDDIKGIKRAKWDRKNPSVIGLEEFYRMKLDDDDPDFLSWDDYVSNDDESEEGDDEY